MNSGGKTYRIDGLGGVKLEKILRKYINIYYIFLLALIMVDSLEKFVSVLYCSLSVIKRFTLHML